MPFVGLNGGPDFKFNEAISFVIDCEDQAEVDRYWDALIEGGGEHGPCGWLKDRFGLSWQVVPKQLYEVLGGSDPAGAQRAMEAMLQMSKLDVASPRGRVRRDGGGRRPIATQAFSRRLPRRRPPARPEVVPSARDERLPRRHAGPAAADAGRASGAAFRVARVLDRHA